MRVLILLLLFIGISKFANSQQNSVKLVKNTEEFKTAVSQAKPGDIITLANGIWNNAELLFETNGTVEKPITIAAEEIGKVTLEGSSCINIAGKYLIVKGLVFTNGFTPTSEVISFKKQNGEYAYNCRVTECVIDNFNGPERFDSDMWIALYGKNNRVDHCYLFDKRNSGVTLAVRLIDDSCRNNNHRIDHNYFGYRQNLGSNGGETMRLGTSPYSLFTCGTSVENNYFESCDGEHEIISNKSCGNKFLQNTFVECRGTLTYRHGNDNIAEGNFFFGNGKEHTGGIRIINKRNKAINNYFYDLKGYRFRGALVIMNGVPNSAINRYHQVVGGEFINNTFINCDNIQLCAGSDAERTAVPVDTKIEKNLFYNDSLNDIFTVYDDISGIRFKDNFAGKNIKSIDKGIANIDLSLKKNEHNIYIPQNKKLKSIGCSLTNPSATRENSGVMWYPKKTGGIHFDTGKEIMVYPGLNSLFDAVKNSSSGDIIVLAESGTYSMNKRIELNHPVTIKSKDKNVKAIITSGKAEVFMIENNGSLKLIGIEISNEMSPDLAGNCIISTSRYSMNCNYKLIIEDCNISNLDVNYAFDFIKVFKNTMADSILIRNCNFKNITGNIMLLDKETEDLGIFNAEYVTIENSNFEDIQGVILNLYRGGTDESTFGPTLKINNCKFKNTGNGKRNKLQSSFYIHGVQFANISNSVFENSKKLELYLTNGDPITKISGCKFINSEGIKANNKEFKIEEVYYNGTKKQIDDL